MTQKGFGLPLYHGLYGGAPLYQWYHYCLNVNHDGSRLIEVYLKYFFTAGPLPVPELPVANSNDLENLIGPRSECLHDVKAPCDHSPPPRVLWSPASTPETPAAALSPAVLHLCSALQLCFGVTSALPDWCPSRRAEAPTGVVPRGGSCAGLCSVLKLLKNRVLWIWI